MKSIDKDTQKKIRAEIYNNTVNTLTNIGFVYRNVRVCMSYISALFRFEDIPDLITYLNENGISNEDINMHKLHNFIFSQFDDGRTMVKLDINGGYINPYFQLSYNGEKIYLKDFIINQTIFLNLFRKYILESIKVSIKNLEEKNLKESEKCNHILEFWNKCQELNIPMEHYKGIQSDRNILKFNADSEGVYVKQISIQRDFFDERYKSCDEFLEITKKYLEDIKKFKVRGEFSPR